MKTLMLAAIATTIMLAGSADAATYAFTAGTTTGSITTGNMSTTDAGFFLLTNVTFTTLVTTNGTYGPGSTKYFSEGAAFNPDTKAFVNRLGGMQYNDSSVLGIVFPGNKYAAIEGLVSGRIIRTGLGDTSGALSVIVPVVTPAVPEPATWAMMLAGFAMVGGAARYRRRNVKVSPA